MEEHYSPHFSKKLKEQMKNCINCCWSWCLSLSRVRLFCDPVDCSPPGFSVRGISQARILEWVAISYSRGSSRSRNQTCVSSISCTGGQILYHRTIWEGLGCLCSNCPGSSGFLRQEYECKYYIWDVPGSVVRKWGSEMGGKKASNEGIHEWVTAVGN